MDIAASGGRNEGSHQRKKGIDRDSARRQIAIDGNRDLGEKVLHLTAIVG